MELNEANLQMLVALVRKESDNLREDVNSEEAEGVFNSTAHVDLYELAALELELIKGIQEAGK